jgi:hypothetical protein
MKNQIPSLRHVGSAELQARKAVQHIKNWIEKTYPRLAVAAKNQLIIECLIEITEERKYVAAQG